MTTYRDKLEGIQLFRIRRLKRIILLLLLVFGVLLCVYGMVAAGASLKPVYLPLGPVVSVGMTFFFVAGATNLVFHMLEVRYAKRDSQRYLILKGSIRRAWPLILVGLILGIILIAPPVHDGAEAAARTTVSGTLRFYNDQANYTFASRDAFGFTYIWEGTVVGQGLASQTISIHFFDGSNSYDSQIGGNGIKVLPVVPGAHGLAEYQLTLKSASALPISFRLVVDRQVAPEFTTILPIVLIVLAVLNLLWVFYAGPIRKKYEASSIYSVQYTEEAEMGERTYADYYRDRAAPSALLSPPTPPPEPTPPPAPAAPAAAPLAPAAEPPAPPEPEEQELAEPEVPASELLLEGSRLYTDGQYDAALAKFDEALEQEPGNLQALLAGAAALLRLNRKEEALGAYDRALELDPRSAKAMMGRAQVFEANAQWTRAADSWLEYLQVVPGDVDARLRRAECVLSTGDRAQAVKVLEEALFIAPADPRLRSRLDALTVNVPALLSKALVASASGRYDEALADLETILSAEPDNVNALVGKGVALRRAGRNDEALATFEVALAKQPGNSAALRGKGAILEEKGDYNGALDVYDDLLAWNPRDPEVWALQASVLERLGEPEEALASVREALKLDPSNAEWKAKASALESSRKGEEEFLEALFTVKGVGPSRARALLAAGYRTADAVRNATEDELANVKGMTRAIARDIYRHFHPEASPAPPPPPPPAPPPETPAPPPA